MNTQDSKSHQPSAATRAEAAAWIARLRGPNRTLEVDAGLRRWLADDPEHPIAFELLTDTWERSARLRRRPVEHMTSWELVGFRLSFSRAILASMVIAVMAVMGTLYSLHSDVVSTGIGELRSLTLQDGTRIHMNSDSRLIVRYGRGLRQVRLVSGEALFEVAKNPHWPFIVTADGHEVRALGTQFDVRSEGKALTVTLIEGKVSVTATSPDAAAVAPARTSVTAPSSRASAAREAQSFTLSPGERLKFPPAGAATIDRPSLDLVVAWEQGQVVLDNTSLADAIVEMNRYSRRRLVIHGTEIASIRLSGIFEAGDSENFANAVATTYHLRVANQSADTIVLSPAIASGSAPP